MSNKSKASYEWKPYVPVGFDGPADTPVEALIRGQNVLFEEERFMKQAWFQNDHPEVDPEDPFCNDWKVCAAGAVLMVTVGAARQTTRIRWKEQTAVSDDDTIVEASNRALADPYSMVRVACPIAKDDQAWGVYWPDDIGQDVPGFDVYEQALEFLRQGASAVTGRHYGDVPSFNDNGYTTRTTVLKAFSKGIALAAKAEAEATTAQTVTQALVDVVTQDIDTSPKVSV